MRNLFVPMLLPPVGLVLVIMAGLLMHRRWPRLGHGLSWAAALALLLMGVPFLSGNALVTLESGYPTTPPADHPPQAIIVLAAEQTLSQQEPGGTRPGRTTLERLRTAAALQRRTGLPILVSGGTNPFDDVALAEVMARSLRDDFGVPVRWVETRSIDTLDNARFSADILRPENIDSVYVVTHAWHMRRAMLAFRGTGLTVTAAPVPPEDLPGLELRHLLPRPSAWETGYNALHEWIGYGFYLLR